MNDNLSIFVTMIVLVVLVVIFPLYNHFERQDDMSYNLVLKATTNFIDEVINCGYIDQEMYTKYVSEIANTGNLYDIQLESHKKIITKDTENIGEYQDQYIVDYNYDIFEEDSGKAKNNTSIIDNKPIKNGVYKLDIGDEIYIKVKNSSTTMAEAIFSTIVPTATKNNITVNYGGIIKNNAWLRAESNVVAKKLVEVKYQVNGLINNDDTQSKYLYHGEKNVQFKIVKEDPSKSGYTFKGWKNSNTDDETTYKKGDTITLKDSMTLVAIMETNTPKVTFDANSGTVTQSQKMVTYNQKYGTLPTPTRDHYTFDGWYTAKTGGILVTQDSTVNYAEDHTLYAHWTPIQYTITFNGNGGTSTTKTLAYNSQLGTLPTSTLNEYTFNGWYTATSGGTQVTTATKVTGNKTYYAQWTKTTVTAGTLTMNSGAYTAGTWTKDNVALKLNDGSSNGSTIASNNCYIYKHNGSDYTVHVATMNGSSPPYELKSEGLYKAVVETKTANNSTGKNEYYIYIDKTPPTCTGVNLTLDESSVTVSAVGVSDNCTTVQYAFSSNGTSYTAYQSGNSYVMNSSASGIEFKNIKVKIKDRAGNECVVSAPEYITATAKKSDQTVYRHFKNGTKEGFVLMGGNILEKNKSYLIYGIWTKNLYTDTNGSVNESNVPMYRFRTQTDSDNRYARTTAFLN